MPVNLKFQSFPSFQDAKLHSNKCSWKSEFGNKIRPSSKDQKAAKQVKRKVRKISMTTTKGAFT